MGVPPYWLAGACAPDDVTGQATIVEPGWKQKPPHQGGAGARAASDVRRVSDGRAGQQAPSHQPGDSARHSEYGRSAINWSYRP